MDESSEPRSAAISAAPDPVGSRQSFPRGPSGPRRSETSPSEPVSAAIAGADVPYPWEAHPPGRIGASPGSLRLDRVATFRPMESRTGRPLVQAPHLQWFEGFEVAVVRKNGADAVLSAERGNLRVEHQVAARIRLASDRNEKSEEFRTRTDNLAARSGGDALDERGRLSHGGRRIEHAPMRHHPHEFRNAEDRKSPALCPLGQSDEPRGRRAMQFGLATVCVNQNVGVNGNHARSITS